MRALVVFESMFGNTRQIAEAIADGLGPGATVTGVAADQPEMAALDGIDLLVVGAPTHAFGLPTDGTRRSARQQGAGETATGPSGLREWLAQLTSARAGLLAATFDTRLAKPRWLPGSAARKAAKRLARLRYPVLATESFFVTGTPGPLLEGEVERARDWAARLGARLVSARH